MVRIKVGIGVRIRAIVLWEYGYVIVMVRHLSVLVLSVLVCQGTQSL